MHCDQSDFTGVASALIRMGATTGPVDEVKFGKELQIVIEKVTQMAPDIIVASTADGTLEILWKYHTFSLMLVDILGVTGF